MRHKAKQHEFNLGPEPMALIQETAVDYGKRHRAEDEVKRAQAEADRAKADLFTDKEAA